MARSPTLRRFVLARELQNRVLDLVQTVFGSTLARESCPEWLLRPGRRECGPLWDTVARAYHDLTGLTLPDTMPIRERRSLDGVLHHRDGAGRVIEVDEAQHFNPYRALTLTHYPDSWPLAFDSAVWRKRALASTKLRGGGWARPRPPLFPQEGGRHHQRAFRDMLADLLPVTYGWLPTVRIAHFEVEEWIHAPDANKRLADLVDAKLERG